MAGMKEQQFTEEKPLLPEQRGQDTEMRDQGRCVNALPCASPAPLTAPSSSSRPPQRWHVIARHWLHQTRNRTSGCIPENCETLMPIGDWKVLQVYSLLFSIYCIPDNRYDCPLTCVTMVSHWEEKEEGLFGQMVDGIIRYHTTPLTQCGTDLCLNDKV